MESNLSPFSKKKKKKGIYLYKMDQIQHEISTHTLLGGLIELTNFERDCES